MIMSVVCFILEKNWIDDLWYKSSHITIYSHFFPPTIRSKSWSVTILDPYEFFEVVYNNSSIYRAITPPSTNTLSSMGYYFFVSNRRKCQWDSSFSVLDERTTCSVEIFQDCRQGFTAAYSYSRLYCIFFKYWPRCMFSLLLLILRQFQKWSYLCYLMNGTNM